MVREREAAGRGPYLWANDPGRVNLYNGADLPASPFRTDDWKMVTAGKK